MNDNEIEKQKLKLEIAKIKLTFFSSVFIALYTIAGFLVKNYGTIEAIADKNLENTVAVLFATILYILLGWWALFGIFHSINILRQIIKELN